MTIIHNAGQDPIIQIANEFTVIQVSYTSTGQRERLLISSPRLGFQTLLDPLQLESLTWQPPETYSKLLDTPYGPGTELNARPLSALLGKD